MTERARMEDQYGVDPSDRQGAGDSSGSSVTNIFTSSSATPKVALDADRPTSLSSSRALRAPTLPAPNPPAHTSDTTTSSFWLTRD
jgi:hypothetical protein